MKQRYLYLFLTLLTFVAGYVFLRLAYGVTDEFPFTQEIVLIVLGTIATIIITAALLNRQTELELRKEQQVKTFELKAEFYVALIDFIEGLISASKITDEDRLRMKFLTHKISIIASPAVLEEYEKFLEVFYKIAKDDAISKMESKTLSERLSHLCSKIRQDLLGDEGLTEEEQNELDEQILENARMS